MQASPTTPSRVRIGGSAAPQSEMSDRASPVSSASPDISRPSLRGEASPGEGSATALGVENETTFGTAKPLTNNTRATEDKTAFIPCILQRQQQGRYGLHNFDRTSSGA